MIGSFRVDDQFKELIQQGIIYDPEMLNHSSFPLRFEYSYEQMRDIATYSENVGIMNGYKEGWKDGFSMGHGLEMLIACAGAIVMRRFGRKKR